MDDPAFEIHALEDGGGMYLVGELDMATVPVLAAALASLPDGKLTLDLRELLFIDAKGLHAIVRYAESLDGGAPLVLENVPARIRRLFEITQLDRHPGIELRGGDDGAG